MPRTTLFFLVMLADILLFPAALSLASSVGADRNWRIELEEVCSQTDVSMILSRKELEDLILRCDELKSRIEAEEETVRKVLLGRLMTCRDLFAYILESKNTGHFPEKSPSHPNEKGK